MAEPATENRDDEVVVRCQGIGKLFPGTVALSDVDLDLQAGTVHVLVGENGAGKSTLMKILAGVQRPTSGRLLVDGREVELHSTLDAERLGIGMIHQELNLCPNLSVTENIYLGREITRHGQLDQAAQHDGAAAVIARLGQDIDVDSKVEDLTIGHQQIVEIAKAINQQSRVLIMDEPTSALSSAEVEDLFAVIRDLTESGVAIVYISHRLEETLEIGDHITVLRDGKRVADAPTADVDIAWIIEMMVGEDPAALFKRDGGTVGRELLRVEDLCLIRGGRHVVDHVSFTVQAGEVVGIYGLMGAGRSELLECLAGRYPDASGQIHLEGELVDVGGVGERIEAGIVLAPEDRQRDGLVQTMSVADNMLLASLRKYLVASMPFLRSARQQAAVSTQIDELGVKVASPSQLITALSGGNQQKVVLAKALLTSPTVLLLDEPGRGIDVKAKAEIFALMSRIAANGYGVVFVSSELKEVLTMSDRVLVLSDGRLTADLARTEATEQALVQASTSARHADRTLEGSQPA